MEDQECSIPTFFMIPLVQLITGLLLLAALLHGQRDLILLTLLVLSLYGGVKLWTRVSLSGITCQSSVDRQKVFPGEKIILKASADNHKFLPVWLQIKIPVDDSLHLESEKSTLTDEGALLWHQRTHFQWELTAQRRGVHQIGPPRLFAGDLLAFSSSAKKEEAFQQILVYPRLVPLTPLSLPKSDSFGVPGAKSPVQDPIYILGTRDYQHGRPAKHIHWKASARHHRLQEKLFEPSAQEKALLIVDVTQFAKRNAEGAFERTLEIAASLAVRLDQRNCPVGLLTNGVTTGEDRRLVPVARNPQSLSAMLELLARVQMKTKTNMMDLIGRGIDLPGGISCVHFSYEEDDTVNAIGEYFGLRRTPVTFFVSEPRFDPGEYGFKDRYRIRSLDDLCPREAGR